MNRTETTLLIVLWVFALAGASYAGPIGWTPPATRAHVFVTTLNLSPGQVFRLDPATGSETADPSAACPTGPLTSLVISKPLDSGVPPAGVDLLFYYYCNAINDKHIYRWLGASTPVYAHETYVREVARGPGGALYFSEASGATADGTIYRLAKDCSSATPYYTVSLRTIGGFWAGHFAFGRDGQLYISNGNHANAAIWQCHVPREGVAARPARDDGPVRIYQDKGPILGFCFLTTNTFLFTNGTPKLMKATRGATTSTVYFASPDDHRYCDAVWYAP